MDAVNPNKRSRADTVGNATTTGTNTSATSGIQKYSEEDINRWLKTLSPSTQQALLRQAAIQHGDIAESIKTQHEKVVGEEATKAHTFDRYVQQASYELNERYERLSSREQYELSGYVEKTLEEILENITGIVKEYHSFQSKFNALEAMREIFEDTINADGELGSQVRKGVWNWGDYLLRVCKLFSEEDLGRLKVKKANPGIAEDDTLYLDLFAGTAAGADSYGCERGMKMFRALSVLQGEDVAGSSDEED